MANGGPDGTRNWIPAAGSYELTTFVDDVNRIAESNETDNQNSRTIIVP